jgi:acyl-CoA dehydrogenase
VRSFKRSEVSTILIGKMVGQLAALRAMSIAITAKLAAGESPLIEAALVKDIGTTLEQTIPSLIADVIGMAPFDRPNEGLFRTLAYVTQIAPAFSLRGGTREILRGVIAHGLGLR